MSHAERAKRLFKAKSVPLAGVARPAGFAKARRKTMRKGKKLINNVMNEITRKRFTFLPYTKSCILPMSQSLNLTSNTTAYVFGTDTGYALNAIWHPRVLPAGQAGYSVNGYTSLAGQYKRYMVYGCDVELEFYDPSQDGLVIGYAIVGNQNSQKFAANTIESSDSRQGFCTVPIANTGQQHLVKKFYVPIHKAEGCTKLTMKVNEANYSAAIAANPLISPYLLIAVANSKDTSAATIQCTVRLNFYTRLFDKVTDSMAGYTVGA